MLSALARDLFADVDEEDLAGHPLSELVESVRSAADLLSTRAPDQTVVRITDLATDGDGSAVTLVEILNDDMPFLVDSTILELQDFRADIRLVTHPIISVTRDDAGRLTAYSAKDGHRESLIQIHVGRILEPADRDALTRRLDLLFAEIRITVADWQMMRDRLEAVVDQYRRRPPPVPIADLEESISFLEWLADDNFTFLGVRDYDFTGGRSRGRLSRARGKGLGILSDPKVRVLSRGGRGMTMTPAIRAFLMRPEPLIITKSNLRVRIHRNAHADYIGVKRYHDDGRLAGETRFIGLFTSTAYNRSIFNVPYLRGKAKAVIARAGFSPDGHSAKTLINVLESYPRDELFQVDADSLYAAAKTIMALAVQPRIRVLTRRDRFDRFVSILVFVPRDRYDSTVRERIGAYLAEVFDGRVSAYYPTFLEGPLTRVQFIIGRDAGKTPNPPQAVLESAVAEIIARWPDALVRAVNERFPPEEAAPLIARYRDAFPVAYQEVTIPNDAVDDIVAFASLTRARPVAGYFHAVSGGAEPAIALKLCHLGAPVALSARVPVLENMGLRVIDELTFPIEPADDSPPIFVHEMMLENARGNAIALDAVGTALIDCFLAVWHDRAENDGYNGLVIGARLTWREIAILRTASRFIRQSGTPFTEDHMWRTLNRHPEIARALVELFTARFDPNGPDERLARRRRTRIEAELEKVESLDEDRIIRLFLVMFDAILRTNYFQNEEDGQPHTTICFKLESRRLDFLPSPRPLREVFVYSPRVEGVHLRFGMVARGGLRWSDRPVDFRTEVLGLAKAQEAKNAVIIPHGAKGGFVPKRLPTNGDRAAFVAEGIAAYRAFISSLLDVTDNLDGDQPVAPPDVVTRDSDDPYLVVAADKGTATFSDIANEVAESRGFWLGDAFASGGSHGYDHKKMGITARGAWESVKRHFREMDIDIQTTPFTVVGVGDMSGDVFGNGMLLSEQIKLVAAFDHRDIFIDPDPDPAISYAERRKLFETPQSSWQMYDRRKISRGGGVFSRAEKAIPLSPQIRAVLDLGSKTAPPGEVMRAILRASADLLFFGGIGTYVRASTETNDQVGDRANDAIRVTGEELRVKVVGEGANLGMTQPARIEFALAGGRCNSDAIDNSAGVNTSDVEVNIKIALGSAIRDGRLDMEARDKLLTRMTEEVAALVLRNNYLQTLAISLSAARGFAAFPFQRRLIQDLERHGLLDRLIESLPDDATLDERQAAGKPLTRPEIGVLVAYAKIALADELMASNVSDHATLRGELRAYFPKTMREPFRRDIDAHRLRAEIIATQVANSVVNHCGASFIVLVADRTGAPPVEIARAYVTVREAFRLRALNRAIDDLDNRIGGTLQIALYQAVQNLTISRTIWFLRNVPLGRGMLDKVASEYGESIRTLDAELASLLSHQSHAILTSTIDSYRSDGVPEDLATTVARLRFLAQATDIHLIAKATSKPFEAAAETYYRITDRFRIDRAIRAAAAMAMPDYYDELARDRALETLARAHRQLTVDVLKAGGLPAWEKANQEALERAVGLVVGMIESEEMTLSRIIVASNLLTDLVGGS